MNRPAHTTARTKRGSIAGNITVGLKNGQALKYGTIPRKLLEDRFAITDMDEDPDRTNLYMRNVLKDNRPDSIAFGDELSHNVATSNGALNLRLNGSRGTLNSNHSEMFIGFTDHDPRGSNPDVNYKALVGDSWLRGKRVGETLPIDANEDVIIDSAPSVGKLDSIRQQLFKQNPLRRRVILPEHSTFDPRSGPQYDIADSMVLNREADHDDNYLDVDTIHDRLIKTRSTITDGGKSAFAQIDSRKYIPQYGAMLGKTSTMNVANPNSSTLMNVDKTTFAESVLGEHGRHYKMATDLVRNIFGDTDTDQAFGIESNFQRAKGAMHQMPSDHFRADQDQKFKDLDFASMPIGRSVAYGDMGTYAKNMVNGGWTMADSKNTGGARRFNPANIDSATMLALQTLQGSSHNVYRGDDDLSHFKMAAPKSVAAYNGQYNGIMSKGIGVRDSSIEVHSYRHLAEMPNRVSIGKFTQYDQDANDATMGKSVNVSHRESISTNDAQRNMVFRRDENEDNLGTVAPSGSRGQSHNASVRREGVNDAKNETIGDSLGTRTQYASRQSTRRSKTAARASSRNMNIGSESMHLTS